MYLTLISLVIGSSFLALLKDSSHYDMFASLIIILFSFCYLFEVSKSKNYSKYQFQLAIGYILRFVLLFYDVYTNDPLHLPLVGGEMHTDPLWFYNNAVSYAQGNRISYGGYFSKMMGRIFSYTGSSRLWGEFIVILFSLATIHVLIHLVEEVNISDEMRRRTTLLVCILPNYAFLSVVFRRETVITFFVSLSLLFFVKWVLGKGNEVTFLLAFVFGILASLFHGATGVIVATYIMIRILYNPRSQKFVLTAKNILMAALFGVLFIIFFSVFGSTFFNKLERLNSVESVAGIRDAGGSSYAQYVGDSRTPLRMAIFTIPRFLYFMYSPFPWQWRGIGDIVAFAFSSLFYLYILIMAISFVRSSESYNQERCLIIALIFIALFMAFVFSWGVANTGTATRHRDKFVVLYAVIYAVSCNYKKRRFRFKI